MNKNRLIYILLFAAITIAIPATYFLFFREGDAERLFSEWKEWETASSSDFQLGKREILYRNGHPIANVVGVVFSGDLEACTGELTLDIQMMHLLPKIRERSYAVVSGETEIQLELKAASDSSSNEEIQAFSAVAPISSDLILKSDSLGIKDLQSGASDELLSSEDLSKLKDEFLSAKDSKIYFEYVIQTRVK